MQRVVSALVVRETDPAQSPFRRAIGAIFASIMIAAITLAGVTVYGFIRPGGSKDWQDERRVIIESETGATFVYFGGELHPTLNFSSAALIAGTTQVARVSHNSLAAAPRGYTVGIPNAPDSLPRARDLVGLPWALCSREQRTDAGDMVTSTVLFVGEQPENGQGLGDAALLVTESDTGDLYLIWRDYRYRIRNPEIVLPALGMGSVEPVPVDSAWLDALPSGVDLERIPVPNRGEPADIPGMDVVIGQVLVVNTPGAAPQYYLVLEDGIAPISEVQAAIVISDPENEEDSREVSASAITSAPSSQRELHPGNGPEQAPERTPSTARIQAEEARVCAVYTSLEEPAEVLIDADVPQVDGLPTATQTEEGVVLADEVVVPPSGGAVVRSMASPNANDGPLYFVSDLGIRFPAAPEVLEMLGLPVDLAVELPSSLVERIPVGPALNPANARQPAPSSELPPSEQE